MQKMVSYDYKKSFYISGHIPGTIRGGGSYHFFLSSYDNYDKVNRCLARYSPHTTTTNRPTNRAQNKPAWPGPN